MASERELLNWIDGITMLCLVVIFLIGVGLAVRDWLGKEED